VLFLIRHHFFRCSKIVAKRKDIGQGRRSFIYTARAARGRGHVFDCVEGRSGEDHAPVSRAVASAFAARIFAVRPPKKLRGRFALAGVRSDHPSTPY
jgi:hypothetical protein